LGQPIPTAIFSLTVGLFTLFGLSISTLGLAMMFSPANQPTGITAIRLTTIAAPADAKHEIAPPALNHAQ
jgi:hypothetical protein